MQHSILDVIKDVVGKTVSTQSAIPEDKKEATIKTSVLALGKGLEENFTLDNISNLTSLFSKGVVESSNPVVSNISSTVIGDLVKKVGLNQGVASSFTSLIVPAVMKALSGKVSEPGGGVNIQSLVQAISGTGDSGGILSTIKKFFG